MDNGLGEARSSGAASCESILKVKRPECADKSILECKGTKGVKDDFKIPGMTNSKMDSPFTVRRKTGQGLVRGRERV